GLLAVLRSGPLLLHLAQALFFLLLPLGQVLLPLLVLIVWLAHTSPLTQQGCTVSGIIPPIIAGRRGACRGAVSRRGPSPYQPDLPLLELLASRHPCTALATCAPRSARHRARSSRLPATETSAACDASRSACAESRSLSA